MLVVSPHPCQHCVLSFFSIFGLFNSQKSSGFGWSSVITALLPTPLPSLFLAIDPICLTLISPLPTAHHPGQWRTPGPRPDHAQLQLWEAALDHQPCAQSAVRVSQQQACHCRGWWVLQPVRMAHVARWERAGPLTSHQAQSAVLACDWHVLISYPRWDAGPGQAPDEQQPPPRAELPVDPAQPLGCGHQAGEGGDQTCVHLLSHLTASCFLSGNLTLGACGP